MPASDTVNEQTMDQVENEVEKLNVQSDEEEQDEDQQKTQTDKDQSKDLKNLDARAESEEKPLTKTDQNKLRTALAALRKQDEKDKEAERLREKELAAVKIDQTDVSLIMDQMQLTKAQAERKLREANGDAFQCLNDLIVN